MVGEKNCIRLTMARDYVVEIRILKSFEDNTEFLEHCDACMMYADSFVVDCLNKYLLNKRMNFPATDRSIR